MADTQALSSAEPRSPDRGGIPSVPVGWLERLGQRTGRALATAQGQLAFFLITLSVGLAKARVASRVVHPMVRSQIHRATWRLVPMTLFLATAFGLVLVGETIALLTQMGAQGYLGVVLAGIVVRELGPLAVALLVLARVGTAYVVELGTARALGEVEALEALGIDPVHYLVVPRVVGLAVSVFALTVYFILVALASGYLFAFLQDVPLLPTEYLEQLADALQAGDFVLLALKSLGFGIIIATFTCYQGLARPIRLEEVANATTRAVVQSIVGCVLLDTAALSVQLLR